MIGGPTQIFSDLVDVPGPGAMNFQEGAWWGDRPSLADTTATSISTSRNWTCNKAKFMLQETTDNPRA
jgi:hypothetical protein